MKIGAESKFPNPFGAEMKSNQSLNGFSGLSLHNPQILWLLYSFPAISIADGDNSIAEVNLCEHDSELSRKLMKILKKFREIDPSDYQLCHLVRQGEQPRGGFFLLQNLVEDQVSSMNGYVDWIQQIRRQVQQNA
ncbi:hypothetical protein Vadar_022458 [Vaccinium darrowii]|uniref:Uncharacterized protein n=1 Tax=Vaccinium darrowii TaxID=229202 RepID=A0ACB7XSP2_9ERIC|nr:hypothetical protein Vadar_022458 [Vaccinium darrowii]